jgi:hypothetical protein
MVKALHLNPTAREPQPEGANPSSHQSTLDRLVTADALEEAGRHKESGLLRDLNQHIMVHEGSIRPAFSRVYPAHNHLSEFYRILDAYGSPRRRETDMGVHRHSSGKLQLTDMRYTPENQLAITQPENPSKFKETLLRTLKAQAREHGVVWHNGETTLKALYKDIQDTPYEDVDTNHPSERTS